jgi:hypothetical protein
MDFERIGRVQDILLSQRVVHSIAPEGRRLRETDAEASDILKSLHEDELDALISLLRGQGWDLRDYTDSMTGIPRHGRVWLLIRRPDASARSLLTLEPAWRSIALRSDEPRTTTLYWFSFIWMLMLSFMYERIGRPVSAESEYIAAIFERGELEEKVYDRIEALRLVGLSQDNETVRLPIAEALLEGGGQETTRRQMQRRISAFLDAMLDAQMIEKYRSEGGEDQYRQTLLCAIQINDLYSQGLIYLVPAEETIDEMNRFLMADRAAKSEEDSTNGVD